jgi:hypothetical protein
LGAVYLLIPHEIRASVVLRARVNGVSVQRLADDEAASWVQDFHLTL